MNAVPVRSRRTRRPPPGSGATKPHVVQFYESPDAILDSATRFLEEGLRRGEGTIIVAVVAHRAALEDRLAERGIDLAAESPAGRFVSLDASETLDRLLEGGFPDLRRFTEVMGAMIASAASNAASGRVRVFGEMVAVLCDRGLRDEAVRLELLWNGLAKTHSFRLLCGYPMKHFEGGNHGPVFDSVCEAHAEVVPMETFSPQSGPGQRDREIAALQQKAASLSVEIGERLKAERRSGRASRSSPTFSTTQRRVSIRWAPTAGSSGRIRPS